MCTCAHVFACVCMCAHVFVVLTYLCVCTSELIQFFANFSLLVGRLYCSYIVSICLRGGIKSCNVLRLFYKVTAERFGIFWSREANFSSRIHTYFIH